MTPNFFIKGMLRIYLNVPYALHFAASRSGRADKRKAQGTVSVPYCLLPVAYCLSNHCLLPAHPLRQHVQSQDIGVLGAGHGAAFGFGVFDIVQDFAGDALAGGEDGDAGGIAHHKL